MDVELLIAEVRSRRALWHQKHVNHHNRGVIDKLWDEVAVTMESSKDAVRTKWKNLKDHFRKELKKLPKNRTGDESATSQTSNWPLFEPLQFLKDQVTTVSDIPCNLTTQPSNNNHNPVAEPSEDHLEDSRSMDSLHPLPMVPTASSPPLAKRRKTVLVGGQEAATQRFLELEERKMRLLCEAINQRDREKCEDYHFFMSLIPHVAQFDSVQKLRVRNKILQVIIDETIGGVTAESPLFKYNPSVASDAQF